MEASKECFGCLETKALAVGFYRHGGMADGYLGKCKACKRAEARAHRAENLERCRAYDRKRGMLPHRLAARALYLKTEEGRVKSTKAKRAYKERNPEKYKAVMAVNNAVQQGRLEKPKLCESCYEEAPLARASRRLHKAPRG